MKILCSFVLLGLVACGGETKPAAAPEPATNVETTAAAPTATAAATPPPSAPAEPAKVEKKVDLTGKWCGKQVPDAASCTGKNAMYVEITASGDSVTGQMCERYNKDCRPLESSTFTGNKLAFGATIKQGAKTDTLKGDFTYADDVLTGEIVSTKAKAPIKTTLYRIK